MTKILNYKLVILFLILIIAAFLRLYQLTPVTGGLPPGLYPDEAMDGNNALESLSTGQFKVFYPENNGREGLFMNIQAVFLKFLTPFTAGNPEPWMLRIVSALFGIFTVLGIYFLAKELFRDYRIGLLSAFLLATSFWHINFSRISFRAIMAPFFAVWAFYFLLKALNSEKYKLSSILGGVFLGLGIYSYIAFRVTPLLAIVVWILYWFRNKEPQARKKIIFVAIIYTLVAIAVFAPLGIYFLKNPADFFGRTTQISIFSSPSALKDLGMNVLKTAGMFIVSGDWNWRHNLAGAPELFWPVGFVFLAGIFGGIGKFLTKKFPDYFIILFSWLIIAALPVVISDEGIPHALRSILLIPPAIILVAAGGVWLYNWIKSVMMYHNVSNFKILNIFTFVFLLALIFQGYYEYFVQWGKNTNIQGAFAADYVTLGRELNALPKELPKYVVVQAGGVEVREIPMPAQTVMYITNTFLPEKQKEKNIHYVLPNQINEIPPNSYTIDLK